MSTRTRPRPTPTPTPAPSPEAGLFAAINGYRSAAGLAPLSHDPAMDGPASDWAALLARSNVLTHGQFSDRLWAVHPGVPIGEDIAEGETTPERAAADWWNDPPHRAILLGDFDSVGVGVHASAAGTFFWVADFARVSR